MTAKQLRDLLEKAGISQTELAERIGVNNQTVHRWCADKHRISNRNAKAITAALKK